LDLWFENKPSGNPFVVAEGAKISSRSAAAAAIMKTSSGNVKDEKNANCAKRKKKKRFETRAESG
jgi:hypothetical protein